MKSVAIFSAAKLGDQPWKPGQQVSSIAIVGASSVDFRQAELEGTTKVSALSILGATRVFVPKGTRVNLSGFSLLGAKRSKLSKEQAPATSPVKEININAVSILGAFQVVD